MLSLLTKDKLISLLQQICEGERKLETCRQLLCSPPSFSPHAVFSRLDRSSIGYLTYTELYNFYLSNNNAQPSTDLFLLLRNIDKYKDSKVTYEEFIDFVLPKQDEGLRSIVTSRIEYNVRPYEFLEAELENGLMRLFSQIITNAKTYDNLRNSLRQCYDYSTSKCFELLKDPILPSVNLNSLDRFLRLNNIILPEFELQAGIMFADVDGDGCLNYNEFSDLLIVGMPAPVQTSPSRLRTSPSRVSGYGAQVNESSILRFSPSRVVNRQSTYQSPSRGRISNSPGGEKVTQKHIEDNYQKVDDNIKYSQYIQKSRENSLKKSNISPSRVYQSSYIASPSRVARSYISPRKNQQSTIVAGPTKEIEKEEFMKLLKRMIEQDRELQNLKTQLSMQQDFNLLDAFRLIDVNQNENISKLELEKGLNKMGIFPTQDQIYLFFKVFDMNQDGFLQYGDFTQVFYTPNNSQVNLLNSRAPGYVEPLEGQSERDVFSFSTRELFKRFFNQVFETETTLDLLREQLQLRPMFNLYEAFKNFDLDQDGIIKYEELKLMLTTYGIYTTENDMLNLFGRFDKNKDGKINYQEFVQEVKPKSPQRYSKY